MKNIINIQNNIINNYDIKQRIFFKNINNGKNSQINYKVLQINYQRYVKTTNYNKY